MPEADERFPPGRSLAGNLVQRDPGDDQGHASQILAGGKLVEDNRADDRGEHREQRKHQREGRPRQPGHGQLVGDVGDH